MAGSHNASAEPLQDDVWFRTDWLGFSEASAGFLDSDGASPGFLDSDGVSIEPANAALASGSVESGSPDLGTPKRFAAADVHSVDGLNVEDLRSSTGGEEDVAVDAVASLAFLAFAFCLMTVFVLVRTGFRDSLRSCLERRRRRRNLEYAKQRLQEQREPAQKGRLVRLQYRKMMTV